MIVIIIGLFLTRRPFYEMEIQTIAIPSSVQFLEVQSNVDLVKSKIVYQGTDLKIGLLGQGFAFPNARQRVAFDYDIQGQRILVKVKVDPQGYFSELQHQLFITLPSAVKDRMGIDILQPSVPPGSELVVPQG